MHQDATCYGAGLSPGDLCSMGTPKKGWSPQFSAHIYSGQTAAWIEMPLGTEVGLGPGDIVLDGDPAPPFQKGGGAPPPFANFRPIFIVAKRLDGSIWHLAWRWAFAQATLLDGDPATPSKKGGSPQFATHVYCAKRLHGSRCHLV